MIVDVRYHLFGYTLLGECSFAPSLIGYTKTLYPMKMLSEIRDTSTTLKFTKDYDDNGLEKIEEPFGQ